MAIQPAQLDDFAIEFETVIGELRFAETDGARNFVHRLTSRAAGERARCTDWAASDPIA